MMKITTSLLAGLILCFSATAQNDTSRPQTLDGLFRKANSVLNQGKTNTGGSALSSADIVAGLKEALALGAQKSAGKLSLTDGFFKDAFVKILLPEEIKTVESKIRMLGMGKIVDDAVLSMNRAAEDASREAAPIFLAAIKKMTVQDALGILQGADTSATGYLRKATGQELTNVFKPVIEKSLKKVNATKYWKDVFGVYNKFSPTPVNSDLNAYVTERALKGIFYYVAEEEKKIRANPAARVSDILKKVFGSK
jgi:hypothetical protein